MMNLKTFLTVVTALVMLTSCGIDDLENRIEKIEDGLGYSEPIVIKFTTTNNNDEVVRENGPFVFEGTYTSGIYDYGNGNYFIWIQRFTNLEYNGSTGPGAYIDFNYNADTGEISDPEIELEFQQNDGTWLYPEFYPGANNMEFNFEVVNFNTETGALNIKFNCSTNENSDENVFEGKPMTLSGSFKGKIQFSYGE